MDAFYQTQEAALQMMADMGAPVEVTSFKVPRSKASRPYIRFRTIGRVVLATLRFQYVRRRKIEYLQAKISKLSPSPSVVTTFGFSPPQAVAPSHSKEHVHSHKQPLLPPPSHFPSVSASASHPFSSDTGHATLLPPTIAPTATASHHSSPSTKMPKAYADSKSKPTKKSEGSSSKYRHMLSQKQHQPSSLPKTLKHDQRQSVKHAGRLSLPSSGAVPDSSSDPQLMAYIKGLEKLQARLSKTKH